LAAVFIPVLFMAGILGRLLHEFAVTITVSILVSGFVSLTLTPMLASRFVTAMHGRKHSAIYNWSEKIFDGVLDIYDRTLQVVMRHRLTTLSVSLAVFVATIYLFAVIPKGFFPNQDTGQIFGITEAAQNISFEAMREHQMQIAKIVSEDTNVAGFMSSIGAGGSTVAGNSGRIFMRLKPRSERQLSADEVIQELRPKLATVPGINVFLQNPPLIRMGGMLTKALYQFSLQDTDTKELYDWVPKLTQRMSELPGFQDVTSDLLIQNPELTVEINRDRASSLGVTPDQIENALYDAYGQRQISTI
jgi:HAE1 family hydrophobic/amphiphilic exporter-1